jgi:hypothetical protein
MLTRRVLAGFLKKKKKEIKILVLILRGKKLGETSQMLVGPYLSTTCNKSQQASHRQ